MREAWMDFLAAKCEARRASPRRGCSVSEKGGAGGWIVRILVLVGILAVLNVLSQVFNWGYIFY